MNTVKTLTSRLREYAEIYAVNERMIQDYPMLGRLLIQAADTIESLCKNKSDNGWIPCSERLPEDGVDVLVWYEYFRYGEYNRLFQTTGISFTHNGKWSGFVNGQSGWKQLSIFAWQPLPSPYEVKSDE